ncbi:MAG: porin [Armatimonadetes bacterium]|nr:porin [Armatimonadota bacterium]
MRIPASLFMGCLLMACVAGMGTAQVAADVPRDHFAYGAITELASKGLVKGFPPQGNFWGSRTATRYEMATIIQRVLARVEEITARKVEAPTAPQPATAGLTPADLEAVRKLVSEYKTELVVIGADLQKARDAIGELRTLVDSATETANRALSTAGAAQTKTDELAKEFGDLKESYSIGRTEFETLSKDVKSHKLSGYLQARFEASDHFGSSLFPENGGAGTTGVNGSAGGITPGTAGYGFLVRRARLKFGGPVSARTDYAIQADLTSVGAMAVKDAYVNVNDLPFPQRFSLTAGLFAPSFGVELPHSSSTRESPERAAGFSDSNASLAVFKTPSSTASAAGTATKGAVLPLFAGQDRDTGVAMTWSGPNYNNPTSKITLGVFNGEGRGASGVRNNNQAVDTVARAQTTLLGGNLDLGISGYYGTLTVRSAAPTSGVSAPYMQGYRMLLGSDVRYIAPFGTTFRAEYAGGVFEASPDRSLYLKGNHAQTWLVSARHPINRRLDLALKYDEFMPISQAGVRFEGLGRAGYIRKTLQGGLLYYMDEATRFRLWYTRGLTPYDPSAAAGPGRSRLGLITGEIQVTY